MNGDTVGDRRSRWHRCRPAVLPADLVGVGRHDLHTDDVQIRTKGLEGGGRSCHQPTAAHRNDDGAGIGDGLGDLEAEGSLTGDDGPVVVRVDETGTGLLREAARFDDRLFEIGPGQTDLGAVVAGGLYLRQGRRLRHEHRRRHVHRLGGECHTLRVVSGRGGNHTDRPGAGIELRDDVHGAANLERPGALQVLGFEPHVPVAQTRERRRVDGRSHDRRLCDSRLGGADLVDRYQIAWHALTSGGT